jgi:uncharacterized membrane protein YgdD (TMEM256/DUF423 family)
LPMRRSQSTPPHSTSRRQCGDSRLVCRRGARRLLSVAAGAAATHLPAGERAAELLRTGALYGMVHAAALIAVTGMAQSRGRPGLPLAIAGCSFAVGMSLFSVSLFALALTGSRWLGMVTPFGGVGLLAGWAAVGAEAWNAARNRR